MMTVILIIFLRAPVYSGSYYLAIIVPGAQISKMFKDLPSQASPCFYNSFSALVGLIFRLQQVCINVRDLGKMLWRPEYESSTKQVVVSASMIGIECLQH
jgi:hypothetical protein